MLNMPIETFRSLNSIDMQLSVIPTSHGDTEQPLSCHGDKCKVKYRWDYTPEIYALHPAVVYPGMEASMTLSMNKACEYKRANDMFADLRIDGTSFDISPWYSTDDYNRGTWAYITGKVETDQRNSSAEVSAFFRGAGYARRVAEDMNHYSLDGSSSYQAKVMPTVSSISHNQGYAEGGQEISITGTSLNGDNVTVTVDGLPCEDVQKVGTTGLTCRTSKKNNPNAPSPDAYIGQQGLKMTHKPNGQDEQEILWTALDLAKDRGFQHNNNKFKGFFKAPYSGDIRFLMSCDDHCNFKMSISDPLNPDAKEELMKIWGAKPWRHTDIADKTSSSDDLGHRFTRWITVTKDQHYYVETSLG